MRWPKTYGNTEQAAHTQKTLFFLQNVRNQQIRVAGEKKDWGSDR